MKKVICVVFVSLALTFVACSPKKPTTEELVGKHAFELLQQMHTISQEEFNSYFITLEEMRDFVNDTIVEETFRNAIKNVSPETHNKRLKLSYEMIKETGKKYEINWQNIRFKEYMYQLKRNAGYNFHDGYVVFVHDEKEFVANIISLPYKGKQRLFNFSNFEPVRNQ